MHSDTMHTLTYAGISKCFHMPIEEAVKTLKVSRTQLKHTCRKLNLARWPYRQLCSMDAMIDALERGHIPSSSLRTSVTSVGKLRDEKHAMMDHGVFTLSTNFKKLRQQYYKAVCVWRQNPQYVLQQSLRQLLLVQAGITE